MSYSFPMAVLGRAHYLNVCVTYVVVTKVLFCCLYVSSFLLFCYMYDRIRAPHFQQLCLKIFFGGGGNFTIFIS